jgi:ketosteroid isomerase-like protein
MSDATIVALYEALHRHDGDAAAACYTPDARFEDPAFGVLEHGRVREMWRMLTASSPDLAVELLDHGAAGDHGHARWRARYTFSASGRPVVNVVDARFRFERELIAEQVDSFPLRSWGRQALGPRGTVLGAAGVLGPIVRRQARARLDTHIAERR